MKSLEQRIHQTSEFMEKIESAKSVMIVYGIGDAALNFFNKPLPGWIEASLFALPVIYSAIEGAIGMASYELTIHAETPEKHSKKESVRNTVKYSLTESLESCAIMGGSYLIGYGACGVISKVYQAINGLL